MNVTLEHQPDGHVIRIAGPLDAAAAPNARETFETVIDAGEGRVDLDMTETTFVDSSGVGAIVFIYKRLVMQGRPMALCGLHGQPRDLIGLLRLDRTIPTMPGPAVPTGT